MMSMRRGDWTTRLIRGGVIALMMVGGCREPREKTSEGVDGSNLEAPPPRPAETGESLDGGENRRASNLQNRSTSEKVDDMNPSARPAPARSADSDRNTAPSDDEPPSPPSSRRAREEERNLDSDDASDRKKARAAREARGEKTQPAVDARGDASPNASMKPRGVVDNLEFTYIPASWIDYDPPNQGDNFRLGFRLENARDVKDQIKIIVSQAPGRSGRADVVFERWARHFILDGSEPSDFNDRIQTMRVEGWEIEFVDVQGAQVHPKTEDLTVGMRLIGAVLHHPSGPYLIRADGKAEDVEAAREDLMKFLRGARVRGG